MDTNIYLHVSNKDSAAYFPQNDPCLFRVKLKNTLNLQGRWKIGLCSIDMNNVDVKDSDMIDAKQVYITCNICTGLIVDGAQTRVVRCIELDTDIHMRYTRIFYLPVEVQFLDTVEFSITTDLLKPAVFEVNKSSKGGVGYVSMTLHLKRC